MAGKNKGGRPEFKPTKQNRTWVKQAADIGLPQELIRLNVVNPQTGDPIDTKTLRKHFSQELDEGLATLGRKLMAKGYQIAMNDDHKGQSFMLKFLLQTRVGLKETTVNELVGVDGQPLAVPPLIIVEGNHPSQHGEELA